MARKPKRTIVLRALILLMILGPLLAYAYLKLVKSKDEPHAGALERIMLTLGQCPAAPGLNRNNTISIKGTERTYDYYVPTGLQSPAPLLFLFHGHFGSADTLTGCTPGAAPYKSWFRLAEQHKIILVFPDGSIGKDGYRGWNDCRADGEKLPDTDDVAFTAELIKEFSERYKVEPRRIYAAGTSNGGLMALRLGVELSNQVTAVAAIVATMPDKSECKQPQHPLSVLIMSGTKDPLVPYEGGNVNVGEGSGTLLSVPESIRFWSAFNKTEALPVVKTFPDLRKDDGPTSVKSFTYSGGTASTRVVLYEIKGGGHLEPSLDEEYSYFAERVLGHQNHDIDSAQEIWKFFTGQE